MFTEHTISKRLQRLCKSPTQYLRINLEQIKDYIKEKKSFNNNLHLELFTCMAAMQHLLRVISSNPIITRYSKKSH